MGQIYKGLAQTGAWGCFDEFNRIPVAVLSVCSTQYKVHDDADTCSSAILSNLFCIGNLLKSMIHTAPLHFPQAHCISSTCHLHCSCVSGCCLCIASFVMQTVLDALRARKERFVFEDIEVTLKSTVMAFITMNPGYPGRAELPESLKVQSACSSC